MDDGLSIAIDVDLELARKFFAQKFSCGCSKSADDELTIQGDVVDELIDLLPEKWNQVSPMVDNKSFMADRRVSSSRLIRN
jgi:density-regulated protein DRP1